MWYARRFALLDVVGGMDLRSAGDSESRFASYVDAISSALGHADRVAPLRAYCTGLILPGARKSVEPLAARMAPGRVQAVHQSLHHFVAQADWSDDAVLAVVRQQVLPHSSGTDGSALGSSTIPASRRKARIPSASPASTAGSSASRITARSP